VSRTGTVKRRKDADRDYLEVVLLDLNTGYTLSDNKLPTWEIIVPDLTVADVAVSYERTGQHVSTDYWTMHAMRVNLRDGATVQLHDIFADDGGRRGLPEQYRLVGPIHVRCTAYPTNGGPGGPGAYPTSLLLGVVVSPAVPMCAEAWEQRRNATQVIPLQTFNEDD